jgi:hypothetical protein
VWHGVAGVADVLSVIIGSEMLKIVPGRVSTEVSCCALEFFCQLSSSGSSNQQQIAVLQTVL